jgi:broad specificity phosphatase PhoE
MDQDCTRLLCIRHGESEGNRERRFCLTPDVPLTPLGREQALQAAAVLRSRFRPSRVISSPYRRAWETAELIAATLALPLVADAGLREQDIGVFAGQPYEAVLADASFRAEKPWSWRPPGGESLEDVAARVIPAVQRIAESHQAQELVLVTHAGVIHALRAAAFGEWNRIPPARNGELVVIEYRCGRFVVREPGEGGLP